MVGMAEEAIRWSRPSPVRKPMRRARFQFSCSPWKKVMDCPVL